MPPVQIIFDSFPPNPNSRRHYQQVAKDNREWGFMAKMLAKHAKAPLLEQAHLHYHFSTGDQRAHDADNLIASTKPITDGLKGVAITDDNIDTIEVLYTFDRAKPRRIVLTITPRGVR